MGALLKDELMNAQLVRAIGYAPYGAADFEECATTASRISGTDLDSWHAEWFATASRIHDLATESATKGEYVSGRGAFFRAANYFRTAGLFAMGSPLDARLVESHRHEVESFRAGAALLPLPPQIIEIPYEGTTLPGYFFRAADDDAPRPLVILVNGYDGTAEELYFTNGAAALERGYHVLAFDGPGQGAMIIDRGIPFRPDWERVVSPVVDVALSLPGVDPAKIALIGLSLASIHR